VNKKSLLTAAGLGLVGLTSAQADNPLNLPNIVLILADDLGYGDLACYGSTKHRTPRLDQMANAGIRFTDFYATAPVCSPTRASLMTGSYPQRVGLASGEGNSVVIFPEDRIGLNTNETTIGEVLKARGYETMIIGKWHLGDQPSFMPNVHGFDTYFGLPSSNDHYTGRDGKDYYPMPLMLNGTIIETEPDQALLTARFTEEAVDFITDNTNTPFFLYLAHEYVHTPWFPSHQFMTNTTQGAYAAEVEQLDYETGIILDTLKNLGLDNNTLVIFTSDNHYRQQLPPARSKRPNVGRRHARTLRHALARNHPQQLRLVGSLHRHGHAPHLREHLRRHSVGQHHRRVRHHRHHDRHLLHQPVHRLLLLRHQ